MSNPKTEDWRNTSPFDADTTTRLVARAIDPGPPKRIFGYDVVNDLAAHYSFGETVLLSLTGELPEAPIGRAFETAMIFLAPVSVAEAPVHASVLARMCGAETAGVVGIGAVGLGEQARAGRAALEKLLDWLKVPTLPAPAHCTRKASDTPGARNGIQQVLASVASPGVATAALTDEAAATAVLFYCGLKTAPQIETALVIARLPALMAEVLAVKPGQLRTYPVNLPPFQYEEE